MIWSYDKKTLKARHQIEEEEKNSDGESAYLTRLFNLEYEYLVCVPYLLLKLEGD